MRNRHLLLRLHHLVPLHLLRVLKLLRMRILHSLLLHLQLHLILALGISLRFSLHLLLLSLIYGLLDHGGTHVIPASLLDISLLALSRSQRAEEPGLVLLLLLLIRATSVANQG